MQKTINLLLLALWAGSTYESEAVLVESLATVHRKTLRGNGVTRREEETSAAAVDCSDPNITLNECRRYVINVFCTSGDVNTVFI